MLACPLGTTGTPPLETRREKMMRVAIVCVALVAGACSRNVYTPPARVSVLEPAATTGRGQTQLVGQFGSHGDLFGPTLTAGGVGARHGLSERLDVVADAAFGVVSDDDEDVDEDGRIGMARAGVKYGIGPDDVLAVRGGLGGGYAPAGGGYVSTDVGAVLSLPFKYFAPWIATAAFVSTPIGAKDVRVGPEDDAFDRGETTAGIGGSFGARVGTKTFGVALGAALTLIADDDENDTFFSLGLSADYRL